MFHHHFDRDRFSTTGGGRGWQQLHDTDSQTQEVSERKSAGEIFVDLIAVENPTPSPYFSVKAVAYSTLGIIVLFALFGVYVLFFK